MNQILPLLYFTHAELSSNASLNASLQLQEKSTSSNDSIGFKSASIMSRSNKNRLKLNINDDNMNYEAYEEGENPFLVGILNKNERIITLCNSPFFIIKPECYLSKTTHNENNNYNNELTDKSTSYADKLNLLTAAFGSSKKRKAMQTKLKNKIDRETLEVAVTAAVEESKKNRKEKDSSDDEEIKEEISFKSDDQFSIVPVPKVDAKTPGEVYNLNEIFFLTNNDLERYTGELSIKFATASQDVINKWKNMNIYSEYICDHLIVYSNSKYNHQYKLSKCKLLAFMHYLIALYRLKPVQLRSKVMMKSSEVPDAVINKLYNFYTVNSSSVSKSIRSIPHRLKDKLTCHIFILALHIDDFSTNIDVFQKDLKLTIQRIGEFYQSLGCHLKNKINIVGDKKVVSKIATLKLPLNDYKKYEIRKRDKKP